MRGTPLRRRITETPFDQFTIEQIAGDLLPASAEQKAATGFHATLTNREGGINIEQFRFEQGIEPTRGNGMDGIDCRLRTVPRPQI
jgi:hypothetical protein